MLVSSTCTPQAHPFGGDSRCKRASSQQPEACQTTASCQPCHSHISKTRRYWIHMIARSFGVASVTFGASPRLYVHRPQPSVESVFRCTLDEPPSSAPRGRRPARTRGSDPVKNVIPRACHALGVPFPDQWKATAWTSLLRPSWETLRSLNIGCNATETLSGFTSSGRQRAEDPAPAPRTPENSAVGAGSPRRLTAKAKTVREAQGTPVLDGEIGRLTLIRRTRC